MESFIIFLLISAAFFFALAAYRLVSASRLQSDKDYITIAWKLITRSTAICFPIYVVAISHPEMSYGGPLAIMLGMCASVGCGFYNIAISRRLNAYSCRTCIFSPDECKEKARKGTSYLVLGSFLFSLFLMNLPNLFVEIPQTERTFAHIAFITTFLIGMAVVQLIIPASWKKQENVKEEVSISHLTLF